MKRITIILLLSAAALIGGCSSNPVANDPEQYTENPKDRQHDELLINLDEE